MPRSLPVFKKLKFVGVCPGRNYALLSSWQNAAEAFDRINRKHGSVFAEVGMKVRMMTIIIVHPNDDSTESSDFRHSRAPTCVELMAFYGCSLPNLERCVQYNLGWIADYGRADTASGTGQ